MRLLQTLTDIFKARGYEVLVSSAENNYLLLRRNGSTLAVGYADPGHIVTEGEAEMFTSIAEDASADSMLFISPERLQKVPRKILEKGGSALWDRMALAIAIGEQALISREKEEEEPEHPKPYFDPQRMFDLFKNDDLDPLTELRDFEKAAEEDFRVIEVGSVNGENASGKVEGEEPLVVQKMDFPEGSTKHDSGATSVSEDVLLGAWAGFEDWKRKEKNKDKGPENDIPIRKLSAGKDIKKEEEAPEGLLSFDMPLFQVIEESPPEKRPWVGAILAPEKCSREEACAKAGVPPDTELELDHVPNLLVSVSYSLRADDGNKVDRTGEYLYDPIRAGLVDIPGALAEELRSTLSVWDGKGPAESMEKASEDDKGYVRALKDRLVREKHAEDRLVRETLMSTIYQEVRYLFDPTSFDVRWSRRIVLPFWVKRDTDGRIKWMVDGYLGRYLPVSTGH